MKVENVTPETTTVIRLTLTKNELSDLHSHLSTMYNQQHTHSALYELLYNIDVAARMMPETVTDG